MCCVYTMQSFIVINMDRNCLVVSFTTSLFLIIVFKLVTLLKRQ